MPDITSRSLAGLAFWARNMVFVSSGGIDWPGFSYTDAEWARFRALADTAKGRFQTFIALNTILFLGVAVLGMAVFFMPLATLMFPVPAQTPELPFALLLAASCFLILGFGLPVTMSIASYLSSDAAMRAKLVPQRGDAELAAKVRWQLWRITIVMCGLLVPGMILFITFNIDAGPIMTVLKWASIGLIALSAAVGVLRRTKS